MYNILICDDERDIVEALGIYMVSEGYSVTKCYNGRECLDIIKNNPMIQLVLLDVMMPEMDGITAMSKIREISNVPIILLTAKSEDTDKVLGLNVGADDYVTKPFNPVELVARVRAQLRRYTKLGSTTDDNDRSRLCIGGIELDDRTKTVAVDGTVISVTPTEYQILKLFMNNPGKVYSPKDIYRIVWEDSPLGNENTVAVHIRHLREKIEINPSDPRHLKVVWGQGYKMEEWHGKD